MSFFFSKIKKMSLFPPASTKEAKKKHYKCLIEDLNKNISLNDAMLVSEFHFYWLISLA